MSLMRKSWNVKPGLFIWQKISLLLVILVIGKCEVPRAPEEINGRDGGLEVQDSGVMINDSEGSNYDKDIEENEEKKVDDKNEDVDNIKSQPESQKVEKKGNRNMR